MATQYNFEEGSPIVILHMDKDEIESALGTVKFDLSVDKSMYSPEVKIESYIGKIFDNYNSIKEQWEVAKNIVWNYIEEADSVPDPEPPEGMEDFPADDLQNEPILSESFIVSTESGNLNVRSGPGTNSKVVGSLERGSEVKVVGYDESGKWAKVNIDGKEYYVSKDYLKSAPKNDNTNVSSSTQDVPKQPITGGTVAQVNVKEGNLNIRGGPGTNSKIVGSLERGTEVRVVGYDESGKWAKIELSDGNTGYVSVKYLK